MSDTPLNRRLIFITGTPRSGTSLITKVVDAHPDIAVLMENIFGKRRRHWMNPKYWNSEQELRQEVEKVYLNIEKPIVGNKVCTPDIWSGDDILFFCRLFKDFKIVFIVRDPVQVSLSRLKREDYLTEFNDAAKSNMLLDFRTRFLTYTSSWRQSIETYWRLRDGLHERVYLVYYEDFCSCFVQEARKMCEFLSVPFSENLLRWYELPHLNSQGEPQKDLKYPDCPVFINLHQDQVVPYELSEALKTIEWQYGLWKRREL